MCYAIPGKIIEINDKIAVVDYFGEPRNVLRDLSEVRVGDYVYAQGGIMVSKIDSREAQKILKFWKKKFFDLKKVDKKISSIKKRESGSNEIFKILQKFNLGKNASRKDLLKLLTIKKREELELLLTTANNMRQKEHNNGCCVHGIIEFSNYCNFNCHYCGIRKDVQIKRYRLQPQEIINIARAAAEKFCFKALVLQSGEDYWYDEMKLVQIVKEIRKMGVLIFLSIGARDKRLYKKLYKAGARAVLLRFETANKEQFRKLRPKTNLDARLKLIKRLSEMGYLISTGFLVGLPEETDNDIIDNIMLTKSLTPDMYSFGPFIPAPGTPLEKNKPVNKNKILKILAISRLVDKKAKILVTSALETLDKDAKREGLLAGANSLMINVTPPYYKEMYHLYPNRPDKDLAIKNNIDKTVKLLYSIGRAPTDLGI